MTKPINDTIYTKVSLLELTDVKTYLENMRDYYCEDQHQKRRVMGLLETINTLIDDFMSGRENQLTRTTVPDAKAFTISTLSNVTQEIEIILKKYDLIFQYDLFTDLKAIKSNLEDCVLALKDKPIFVYVKKGKKAEDIANNIIEAIKSN